MILDVFKNYVLLILYGFGMDIELILIDLGIAF